jgi:hypothetical protein
VWQTFAVIFRGICDAYRDPGAHRLRWRQPIGRRRRAGWRPGLRAQFPSAGPGSSGTNDLTVGTAWSDSDGCLYALIKVNGQVIATRPAGLCRAQDAGQTSGTFYLVYPSGQDSSDWILDAGSMNPDDGYIYWAFRSVNVWLRAPGSGSSGDVEIKLSSGEYEPLTDFAEQNPAQYNEIMPAELQAEASYRQFLSSAVTSVGTAAQSGQLTSGQQDQAEQQIQGLEQQNQQLQTQLSDLQQQVSETQSQAQNAGSSAAWQELYQTENEIAQGTEIWTEPECDFSYNGCAP